MAKRYYFTNENGEWIGKEYTGNIRGARTAAKRLANEFGEEITINTCKEIEYVGEISAGEEIARVCDAYGDVMVVCGTPGAAEAWCALNGITGEIGEFEPYIELGIFHADGNFEVDDYLSINEYFGKETLANHYFQAVETVYPDRKPETIESTVESVEETTIPETETESEPTTDTKTDKTTAEYQTICPVCDVNGATKSLALAKWNRRNSGQAP